MNAKPVCEGISAPPDGVDGPFYFESGKHRLFAWLHRPAAPPTADLGVVVCKPFGYESLCAHRSVRTFAEAAAAEGLPALRFDYVGTGDSSDLEPGVNQLEAWVSDVVAAIDELRRRTGVRRICLLGFRLGALLAALAGARRADVSGLIAVAPVVSGARYLRELRTLRLAAAQRAASEVSAGAAAAVGTERSSGEQALEAGGFSLEPASMAQLITVDLLKLQGVPAQSVLVIDRNDIPGARGWADNLSTRGVPVQYMSVPGFVQMMMTEPQIAVVPQAMITAARSWLTTMRDSGRRSPAVAANEDRPPRGEVGSSDTVLNLPGDATAPQLSLTERPTFITTDPALFGIVTEPRTGETRRRAVLLLNDGATHHVGSNRMGVVLARRWARHGYVVLRLDLAGLGDSGTRAGRPGNEVFPTDAMEDVRAAVEFLRLQYGIRDLTIGGLCSGAYHALRAAVLGMPVSRLLMVNPLNFYWGEGMAAGDVELAEVIHNARRYRQQGLSGRMLKRLFTGEANIPRLMHIIALRAWTGVGAVLQSGLKHVTGSAGSAPGVGSSDAARRRTLARRVAAFNLGEELEKVAASGVKITFVFSRGEAGVDLLKMLAGRSIEKLGDACRVRIIEGADHIFSQSAPRATLVDTLSNELYTHNPNGAPMEAEST